MMKAQEVILKAAAGKLKWWEAAEIMGVTDRTMRRWRERLAQDGYDGRGSAQNRWTRRQGWDIVMKQLMMLFGNRLKFDLVDAL